MTRRRSYRAAQRHGLLAETLCAWTLRFKLYRILARHWRTPVGEIDLVALRGRTVAFVEVKARASLTGAAEALLPRQRQRIARAAAHFMLTRPDLVGFDQRFDVMLVAGGRLPVHLVNAWHV